MVVNGIAGWFPCADDRALHVHVAPSSVGIKLFPVQRPLWKELGRGGRMGTDASWLEPLQGLAEALKSEWSLEDEVLRVRSPMIES